MSAHVQDKDESKTDTIKMNHKVDFQKVDSIPTLGENLIDIQEINSEILVDLKYATSDNFMKTKLYSRLNRAFLQKDVALRLSNCQNYLSQIKPGYKLLIYDAARPVRVQQKMWDAMDSLPPVERGKYVSNPRNRSLHNLGAAVDLTICDESGNSLDMGAGYDDFREIAYPELEKQFLKSGELTKQHIQNRELLRKVMRKEGFRNIPTEWWHFNACSRKEGLTKYQVLMEEP
jgi:D-alanyl-D-alanine dipeptidase